MHGFLVLSLLIAAREAHAQSPRLERIPSDSTVCVRTTHYFPEIRQSVRCETAGWWRRLQAQARAESRTEERLRQARLRREREWERRQELARAEERQARDSAERRESERRRSEDRRLEHQGKMPS